jgi:hypothetical protein
VSVFAEACQQIESAYAHLGHDMGWRFLNSPSSLLARSTPIAPITLNPGGSINRADHARESSEHGSAYVLESWGRGHPPGEAPLQLQIRRLFSMLSSALGREPGGDGLLHASLSAHFVPFRSPSIASLHRREESFEFASDLWRGIFDHLDPRLLITIDRRTTDALERIFTVTREVFSAFSNHVSPLDEWVCVRWWTT